MAPEKPVNPAPKRRGRPVGSVSPRVSPEDKTKPRSIRLNDERWAKLQLLGREWLERAIDKARAQAAE